MIHSELLDSDIAGQGAFVNPAKGTQEITQASPTTFIGVDMDFSNSVTIGITSPLLLSMTDGQADTGKLVVTIVFVGIHSGIGLSKLLDERT